MRDPGCHYPFSHSTTKSPNLALFFGDLNARHTYWGDKSCKLLGEELVQIADHFSILNDGEPTFLAANGYSVIDLCICYGPLFDR